MTNVDHQPAATDAPPSSVFFSYSRDDQARALPIIRQIEAAGFPTWWDGMLEGGERYVSATQAALNRARAVVVLWTGISARSHWVHDEATRGRDRGILVPLSLDDIEPPLSFGQFQVIDMSRARIEASDPAVQRLIKAIATLHDRSIAASSPSAAPATAINRRAMIGSMTSRLPMRTAPPYWHPVLRPDLPRWAMRFSMAALMLRRRARLMTAPMR